MTGGSGCIMAPSSYSPATSPLSISISWRRALERRISGLSLDTFAEDLDDVLAQLRLEPLALLAIGPAVFFGLAFLTARTPSQSPR
jgi:hypothetical protein